MGRKELNQTNKSDRSGKHAYNNKNKWADPEYFVRGGPTLEIIGVRLQILLTPSLHQPTSQMAFLWCAGGGSIIGPPGKRHLNGVSLMCR